MKRVARCIALPFVLIGLPATVQAHCRTGEPGIWAIGDLIGTPWLAHVASMEGVIAVEPIAGKNPRPIDPLRIPNCTYCSPEVGSIGLTEPQAKERGYQVKVGTFPFSALAKASILGETAGFVKIVADARYDEILGVHIVGPYATELIAEGSAALAGELTAEELIPRSTRTRRCTRRSTRRPRACTG